METFIRLRSGDILLRDIHKMEGPAPRGRGWMHVAPGAIGPEEYYPLRRARALIHRNGVERVRRGDRDVWPRGPRRGRR